VLIQKDKIGQRGPRSRDLFKLWDTLNISGMAEDTNLKFCMRIDLEAVFALSGIASQNAMQIDSSCDSKCHVDHTHARYNIKTTSVFDKNTMLLQMAMD